MKNRNSNNGMALVSAVMIMLVVVLLGQSMILLTRNESKKELDGRLYEAAFYVADAGIEKAIMDIKNDSFEPHFIDKVGRNSGRIQGEAEVTILPSGSYYVINSTGHIPSLAQSRVTRSIRAVVAVRRGGGEPPRESIVIGASGAIGNNVTVEGVIFSNGHITIGSNITHIPDKYGNCALYSAHTESPAISIGPNYKIDRYGTCPKEEIRARSSIIGKDNITATVPHGVPLVTEHDTSELTDKSLMDSYYDTDAFLASVTHTNHSFGGQVTFDSNMRAAFHNNVQLDLKGGVYLYTSGVEFHNNVNVVSGGTIVVSTRTSPVAIGDKSNEYDYGIAVNNNIYGSKDGEYAELNLIVLDGDWKIRDIRIRNNVKIHGVISGSADVSIHNNVDVKGILIAGGDLGINNNLNIINTDPPISLPWA
ncbi:MAG: hypothetical protein GX817_04510, partial [Elusimicrobia bacterium]|nr:hypothetical protein [Elusimicrobiota bacterium]